MERVILQLLFLQRGGKHMSQTRRFIQPFQIIENQSMASNITTPFVDISNVDDISIVYEWSAGSSPVGSITVEVRNGELCPWSVLDIAPPAAISLNSGNNNIQITNVSFKELRLVYERTSGSGTLNAWLTGKGK